MPLLVCHVGARRVRVIADVRVEWPERRGSVACRDTWERLGRNSWGQRCRCRPRCRVGAPLGRGVVCCRWRAMRGLGGGA